MIAIVRALTDYLYLGGRWSLGMHVIQWQSAACRAVGNRAGEGTTLNNLGTLTRSLGQPDEARAHFEQALLIHREVGNRAVEGTTLNNLGALADDPGQKEKARRYYEQALAIFQEIGAEDSARIVANNLANFDADNRASDEAPGVPPGVPEVKTPPRHRRRWQHKPAQ